MIRKRGTYWQVRVYAGLDPLAGKRRDVYDPAPTRKQAEMVEAGLVAKVAEGQHRGTARTVAELVERWLDWRQGVKEISPPPCTGTGSRSTTASSLRSDASRFSAWTPRRWTASTPSCAGAEGGTASRSRPARSARCTRSCRAR